MSKEIKASDIKKLLLSVYRRYVNGNITEAQAIRETTILNSVLKAIEVVDLDNRIERVEEAFTVTLNLNQK
jgi:hypothetical protein